MKCTLCLVGMCASEEIYGVNDGILHRLLAARKWWVHLFVLFTFIHIHFCEWLTPFSTECSIYRKRKSTNALAWFVSVNIFTALRSIRLQSIYNGSVNISKEELMKLAVRFHMFYFLEGLYSLVRGPFIE